MRITQRFMSGTTSEFEGLRKRVLFLLDAIATDLDWEDDELKRERVLTDESQNVASGEAGAALTRSRSNLAAFSNNATTSGGNTNVSSSNNATAQVFAQVGHVVVRKETTSIVTELASFCRAVSFSIAQQLSLIIKEPVNYLVSCRKELREPPRQLPQFEFDRPVIPVLESIKSNIKRHKVPVNLAREAVFLQYSVDTELDKFLYGVISELLFDTIMRDNPYGLIVDRLKSMCVKFEGWKDSDAVLLDRLDNKPNVTHQHTGVSACSSEVELPQDDQGAYARWVTLAGQRGVVAFKGSERYSTSLYGSYAAVQVADPGYLIDLVSSANGNAFGHKVHVETGRSYRMSQCACACHDAPLRGRMSTGGADMFDPSTLFVERCFFVEGPTFKQAINLYAQAVTKYWVWLNDDTANVVQRVMVGDTAFDVSQLKLARYRHRVTQEIVTAAANRLPIYVEGLFLLGRGQETAESLQERQRRAVRADSALDADFASLRSGRGTGGGLNSGRRFSRQRTGGRSSRQARSSRPSAHSTHSGVVRLPTRLRMDPQLKDELRYVPARVDLVCYYMNKDTRQYQSCLSERPGQAYERVFFKQKDAVRWFQKITCCYCSTTSCTADRQKSRCTTRTLSTSSNDASPTGTRRDTSTRRTSPWRRARSCAARSTRSCPCCTAP
eukprot:TRINITY_DN47708_c0_g1_i1.p1 TRINITY_DN47708_c0_g1~~TRINITY_DN47708_c0_g1_i1.p1  ORF type:complete len:751 (+),score=314.88 TRINITY_DN47708_c0_g1_i1:249-2255(+)